MTKQEQFLWIVQTTILANGLNMATDHDRREKYKTEFSATGVLIVADAAVRVSVRIPGDLSAFDAANEFCTYMLRNLRQIEEDACGKRMEVPAWFAEPDWAHHLQVTFPL